MLVELELVGLAGHVAVAEMKHMLLESQQALLPAGGLHTFAQSASMLHMALHPPEEVEVVAEPPCPPNPDVVEPPVPTAVEFVAAPPVPVVLVFVVAPAPAPAAPPTPPVPAAVVVEAA